MDVFPAELVEQCLCYHASADSNSNGITNNEQEPGELLQLVLSVLGEDHGDDENNWTLDDLHESLLPVCATTVDNQNNSTESNLPSTFYHIMTAERHSDTPSLIAATRGLLEGDATSASTHPIHKWVVGLYLIAVLLRHPDMKAFEVHAVTLQSAFLGGHTSSRNNPQHYAFWTLLMLLCSWSLEACHQTILQQHVATNSNRTIKMRWKRMRSLLMETLQLFQRHASVVENSDHGDEDVDEEDDDGFHRPPQQPPPFSISVPLWVDFILPVGQSLWNTFPDTIRGSSSACVFWQATAVGFISHLAVQQPPVDTVLLDMMYESLGTLDHLSWDLIWCHPWRVANHRSRQQQYHPRPPPTRHESLDWWTLERYQDTGNDTIDGDDDDASSTRSPPPDDYYEGIDTSWNDLGLATLLWVAWQTRSPTTTRPFVYSALYEWQMCFPHVATLLNPDPHPNNNNTAVSLEYVVRGIALLRSLLPMMPTQSLSIPVSFSLAEREDVPSIISRHQATTATNIRKRSRALPPDHPVGTFQLLLNTIVEASTPPSSSPRQPHLQLPSAMQIYGVCKDLLSKYTPAGQLNIVLNHLLPTCPHAGLRPKLLDLLRPLLAQFCSTSAAALKSDNKETQERLWHSLEEMVGGLGKYCDGMGKPTQEQEHRDDRMRMQNVEDLVDETEYFVSVCAMIQLGWNMMRNSNTATNTMPSKHPRSILLRRAGNETNQQVTLRDFHAA